jgi:hypothetical protein
MGTFVHDRRRFRHVIVIRVIVFHVLAGRGGNVGRGVVVAGQGTLKWAVDSEHEAIKDGSLQLCTKSYHST